MFLWVAVCLHLAVACASGSDEDLSKRESRRVLLVTGEDYPGHNWRKTTPVLKAAIERDRRLRVDVVDELRKLAVIELRDYAAVVLHFKNYDPAVPGQEALANLGRYVDSGGGIVLVHFACGAFQEQRTEFEQLAGRVWEPSLRGHDPHGAFRVEISDHDHPITRDMHSFETTDELYTCLVGAAPITVLASANSKVDGRSYPIAFVMTRGEGRVFHCVLGHDVPALQNEEVGKLFCRGTLWAAEVDEEQNQ
jgi:type 1 glutamine amidotransferase